MTIIDLIKNGNASEATSLLEKTLRNKTMVAIQEEKHVVAEATYGEVDEEEVEKNHISSLKEAIGNPNSSGQGFDPDYVKNPHHEAILDAGYEYSHSTPVTHMDGEVRIHHTYKHPDDRNQNVSVWPNQHGQHSWATSRSGPPIPQHGNRYGGTSTEELKRHLKDHVARWMKKRWKPATKVVG
jgi:predicted transcriptional regulator